MESIIEKLKKELSILYVLANQRGISSVKKNAKKAIPEYERAIEVLQNSVFGSGDNKWIPINSINEIKDGFVVKNLNSNMQYVVTSIQDGKVMAVGYTEITNVSEWLMMDFSKI